MQLASLKDSEVYLETRDLLRNHQKVLKHRDVMTTSHQKRWKTAWKKTKTVWQNKLLFKKPENFIIPCLLQVKNRNHHHLFAVQSGVVVSPLMSPRCKKDLTFIQNVASVSENFPCCTYFSYLHACILFRSSTWLTLGPLQCPDP